MLWSLLHVFFAVYDEPDVRIQTLWQATAQHGWIEYCGKVGIMGPSHISDGVASTLDVMSWCMYQTSLSVKGRRKGRNHTTMSDGVLMQCCNKLVMALWAKCPSLDVVQMGERKPCEMLTTSTIARTIQCHSSCL